MSLSNFGGGGSANTKQAIMQQVQQEAAVSNVKSLMTAINSQCFEKCVPKPGSSLSSGEETCISQCMEKYMNTWNTTSKTYVTRLQQEQSARNPNGGPLLN